VGEVCDSHGGLQELRTEVWWGNLKGMEHLKELILDGAVILSGI
jgi:hypothetical protein